MCTNYSGVKHCSPETTVQQLRCLLYKRFENRKYREHFVLNSSNVMQTLLNLLIIHLSQWLSMSSHFTSLCLSTCGGTS